MIQDKAYDSDLTTLYRKSLHSGVLVFILNFIEKGLSLIRIFILARLLLPEHFGLIGICWLFISTVETFSQTGFYQALIQKKGSVDDYFNTTWLIHFTRGIVLYILVYFSAPLIERFFNSSGSTEVLRILGLTLILSSVTNIGMIAYIKEINFRKQFLLNLSGTIIDIAVSIILAFYLRNVWAFVWGHLAGTLIRASVSYILHPFRPTFSLDWEKTKELLRFGKWVSLSTVLVFLITNGDDAFVGKFIGLSALGLYQMAYRISNMPATEITHVISQITFPVYSALQDNLTKLRETYLKVLKITAVLSIPIAGMIFILTPDLILVFLGKKWISITPLMQILCLFGALRALNATTGSVFQAMAKPEILSKISFFQFIFIMITIFPFLNMFKLFGISLSVTLANFLCFILAFKSVSHMTRTSLSHLIKILFPSLSVTAIIIIMIYTFKLLIFKNSPLYINFTFSVLIGLSIYLAFLKIIGFSFTRFISQVCTYNESKE